MVIISISVYYFTPTHVMKILRNLGYRQHNPIRMTHLESKSSLVYFTSGSTVYSLYS